ncbi:MAG: tetratricopeptide repeat protein [Acidobacteriota bacterium]
MMKKIEKQIDKNSIILVSIGLGTIIYLLYFPVFSFPFHNWDDGTYIYKNNMICRGLNWETVKWAFTTNYFGFYYPLTWLSHATDVSIFGLSPKGHYLHNIVLHFLNALLLYIFLLFVQKDICRALMVAVIFAVHPMNVESVAWLAERKNLLATFFMLLTLLFYYLYQRKETQNKSSKIIYYFLSLSFYFAGLISKSSIVMLPFLLILFDIWPFKRINTSQKLNIKAFLNILKDKIIFFILSLFSGVVTIFAQKELKAIVSFDVIPFSQRVGEAVLSLWFYILKYFFPFNLAVFYEHHRGKYPFWKPFAIATVIIVILFIFFRAFKKRSQLLIGFIFFLISLLPVLGFIQVGLQGKADRYVYLPYWGLSIILIYGFLSDKIIKNKLLFFSLLGAIVVYFFTISHQQIKVWESDKTLFENVVKVQPKSFLGYLKLGNYYYFKENYDKALENYLKASQFNHDEPLIYCNIGTLYYFKKNYNEALSYYDQSININPKYAEAYYWKGVVLMEKREYEKSLSFLMKAKEMGYYENNISEKIQEVENIIKKGNYKYVK